MAATDKQLAVLAFIKRFSQANGYPPTRTEIASEFGFKSPHAAQGHLEGLVRHGHICLKTGIARGITLCEQAEAR